MNRHFRGTIRNIISKTLGEDGNVTGYFVSFHDTFEPIENIHTNCYPMINELQPGLLDSITLDHINHNEEQIAIVDDSTSENQENYWAVDKIVAVTKSIKVSLKTVLYIFPLMLIYLIIVSLFHRVTYVLLSGRINGYQAVFLHHL